MPAMHELIPGLIRKFVADGVKYEGTSKSFRTLFFKKSLFVLQT